LTIDSPELKKLPGVLCTQCKEGQGCQIYETRPPVCRGWFCGWRVMPQLDDSWRPDISQILVTLTGDDIPPSYKGPAVRIDLLGPVQKILWPPLVNFIGGMLERRVPLFLSVPGAPGYVSAKVFLNEAMAIAHASRNLARVQQALLQAVELCADHPAEKVELD
jgi:hypothetical protein